MLCRHSEILIIIGALWPLALPARAYRQDLRRRGEAWGSLWLFDPRLVVVGVGWSIRQQYDLMTRGKDAELHAKLNDGKVDLTVGIYTEFILLMAASSFAAWYLLNQICGGSTPS